MPEWYYWFKPRIVFILLLILLEQCQHHIWQIHHLLDHGKKYMTGGNVVNVELTWCLHCGSVLSNMTTQHTRLLKKQSQWFQRHFLLVLIVDLLAETVSVEPSLTLTRSVMSLHFSLRGHWLLLSNNRSSSDIKLSKLIRANIRKRWRPVQGRHNASE